ncbi:MAG: hypothetical protein C4581_05755 [Nitrospiraceae bacterium]|nr:MAG: hypothetical protein C4581_05755 [Nitrospiraceae bacterium]
MSSSSIVIESKHIAEHKLDKYPSCAIPPKLPIKDKKYEAIKIRIYRHVRETIISSAVVFACLALYKISGLCDWWLAFVSRILFTH